MIDHDQKPENLNDDLKAVFIPPTTKVIQNSDVLDHWPDHERVLDRFWSFICFLGPILNAAGVNGGGDNMGPGFVVMSFIILWGFLLYFIQRPCRFIVSVTGDVVHYEQYRCFGFWCSKKVDFPLASLGCLVFDTERRLECCKCSNFIGVYVTFGLPDSQSKLNVAFEFPMMYNGWNHLACEDWFTRGHRNSFMALERILRFRRIATFRSDQTASETTIVSGGTYSDHMNVTTDNMAAQALAAMNSYDSFASFNPQLLPQGRFTCRRNYVNGRAVFYIAANETQA